MNGACQRVKCIAITWCALAQFIGSGASIAPSICWVFRGCKVKNGQSKTLRLTLPDFYWSIGMVSSAAGLSSCSSAGRYFFEIGWKWMLNPTMERPSVTFSHSLM